MLDTFIVLGLFAIAVFYLGNQFYQDFSKKEGCSKGCANCSVAEIEKITQKIQEKINS
jgi:hypothetical protein